MPFGLRNAASTFQRFMDEVVRDLDFVYNYIDDILVASASPEEHVTHLRLLFERFQKYQVRINPGKCVFGASSLTFLGHIISPEGISPLPEKSEGPTRPPTTHFTPPTKALPRSAQLLQTFHPTLYGSPVSSVWPVT